MRRMMAGVTVAVCVASSRAVGLVPSVQAQGASRTTENAEWAFT